MRGPCLREAVPSDMPLSASTRKDSTIIPKESLTMRFKFTPSTIHKQLNRQRIIRWLLTSTLIIFSIAGLGPAGWLFSCGVPRAGAAQQNDISPEALAQIEALIKEKQSRAGAELKIYSQLIYGLKMRRGEMIADGVRTLETDLPYNDDGKLVLDIKAVVTNVMLNQLRAYGADIVSSSPQQNSVRIQVDIGQIEAIAAMPDVSYIQPKQDSMTSRGAGPTPAGARPDV